MQKPSKFWYDKVLIVLENIINQGYPHKDDQIQKKTR